MEGQLFRKSLLQIAYKKSMMKCKSNTRMTRKTYTACNLVTIKLQKKSLIVKKKVYYHACPAVARILIVTSMSSPLPDFGMSAVQEISAADSLQVHLTPTNTAELGKFHK